MFRPSNFSWLILFSSSRSLSNLMNFEIPFKAFFQCLTPSWITLFVRWINMVKQLNRKSSVLEYFAKILTLCQLCLNNWYYYPQTKEQMGILHCAKTLPSNTKIKSKRLKVHRRYLTSVSRQVILTIATKIASY